MTGKAERPRFGLCCVCSGQAVMRVAPVTPGHDVEAFDPVSEARAVEICGKRPCFVVVEQRFKVEFA